jgi:protein tyrosine/serine phosphatase
MQEKRKPVRGWQLAITAITVAASCGFVLMIAAASDAVLGGASGERGLAGIAGLFDNFHEVIPGELYRSAQPSAHDLIVDAARYRIRTVINLRGPNAGKRWYDSERRSADALGLRMIDVPLSAKHVLSGDQAEALIETMRGADKPILLHCASGADRTSLAAALYLAAIAGRGEGAAEAQMSWRFGHIALPTSRRHAIDDSFELMEPRFGYKDS